MVATGRGALGPPPAPSFPRSQAAVEATHNRRSRRGLPCGPARKRRDPVTPGQDSLKTRRTLKVKGESYDYFSLDAASEKIGDISRLPYSLKVLDRKSTRLNSSHVAISYAVFCLKTR